MPSLHVAYALLVVVQGWPVMSRAWRGAAVAFFLLMCFSAVYLDHHWVLDVVAGVAYCLCVMGAVRAFDYLRMTSSSAVTTNAVEGVKAPPAGDAAS
jgi:membrane-associated phospholipid phosphatase